MSITFDTQLDVCVVTSRLAASRSLIQRSHYNEMTFHHHCVNHEPSLANAADVTLAMVGGETDDKLSLIHI